MDFPNLPTYINVFDLLQLDMQPLNEWTGSMMVCIWMWHPNYSKYCFKTILEPNLFTNNSWGKS